jgi:hypothetical protein
MVAAGLLLWQLLWAAGPFYHGKPLTAWLRQARTLSPSTPEEKQAAEAIRQIGERAVPYLTHALTNTDPNLRTRLRNLVGRYIRIPPAGDNSRDALWGFAILGPRAKSAVPTLAQTLCRPEPGHRQVEAAFALGAVGPDGWRALREALSSTNRDVCWASAEALYKSHVDDPATVRCFIAAATNHPGHAGPLLATLPHFKSERSGVVSFFIAELSSPAVGFRKAAMEGLGSLGEASGPVIPLLRSALESTNEDESFTAVKVLGQMGAKAQAAEPALLDMIQRCASGGGRYFLFHLLKCDGGTRARVWSYSLGSPKTVEQIETLAAALNEIDPNWKDKLPSRLATGPALQDWLALGRGVEPRSEGPTLQQWLLTAKGEEPRYHGCPLKQWLENGVYAMSASESFDRLTSRHLASENATRAIGTNAIPWLLAWLLSESGYDALDARRGFRFLGRNAQPALPALVELAQSKAPAIRRRAYGCLNALELDWDTAWPAIIPALHHTDPAVREDAAGFLMDRYPGQAQSVGLGDFVPRSK